VTRRRPDTARVLTIPVECPHPGRREVVTHIRVHEWHRDGESRAAAARSMGTRPDGSHYQAEPLDDWTDGIVADPMPHTQTVHATGVTSHVKVRLRCPAPSCPLTLEASPEVADLLVDRLVATDERRVELRVLVSRASRLGAVEVRPASSRAP